jgi:hypothetical protein
MVDVSKKEISCLYAFVQVLTNGEQKIIVFKGHKGDHVTMVDSDLSALLLKCEKRVRSMTQNGLRIKLIYFSQSSEMQFESNQWKIK